MRPTQATAALVAKIAELTETTATLQSQLGSAKEAIASGVAAVKAEEAAREQVEQALSSNKEVCVHSMDAVSL